MKIIQNTLLIALFSLSAVQCKKSTTYEGKVSKLSIQTHLDNSSNFILCAFALQNNTFVVGSVDLNKNDIRLFSFDKNMFLIDSIVFKSHLEISDVVVEDNGTFTFICRTHQGALMAYNINSQLEIVQQRNISFLSLPVNGGNGYPHMLCKLSTGNYILANNNENGNGNKIALVAVENLFTSTKRLWSKIALNWEEDWLAGIYPATDSTFYITGYQNTSTQTDNFVKKYDQTGTELYRKSLPLYPSNNYLLVEKDRNIFLDYSSFHIFETDGTDIGSEPIVNIWDRPNSNILVKNNHYFYAKDIANQDGFFVELRKLNSDLKVVKTKLIGNQGSNLIWNPYHQKRYLISMANGDMISVSIIENPMLSGNQWLMVKFDADLN